MRALICDSGLHSKQDGPRNTLDYSVSFFFQFLVYLYEYGIGPASTHYPNSVWMVDWFVY